MKKKLVYILPTNFNHEGIKIKVLGQLSFFNKEFKTKLIKLNYKKNEFILISLIKTLIFEIKSISHLLIFKHFFIRYNPKSFLINFTILFFSYIKKITIEHNLKMEDELKAMNRPLELLLHKITLRVFKFSKAQHLCVNMELKQALLDKGFNSKQLIYHQNGYLTPKITPSNLEEKTILNIKKLKKSYSKTAIFVGSGRPWHGLDLILSLFLKKIECGIIVIGPYNEIKSKQLLFIPHANSSTISEISNYCDFGISNFNWEQINITEGSPLKSRQYLCNGLPILTNYKDSAEEYPSLKPFIFNLKENSNAITDILNTSYSKNNIKKVAQKELSWDNTYINLRL